MKVYTGGGDKGKTSLFSGERVAKNHDRVEAYGDLDELSSTLGALVAAFPDGDAWDAMRREVLGIQADLMTVGALLATLPGSDAFAYLESIGPDKSAALEAAMDRMDAELPALRTFLLPGGHPSACWAHMGRTVCRRAERRVVGLIVVVAESDVPEYLTTIQVYLNRLSDYLFVLARYCNYTAGVADIPWKKGHATT